MLPARSGASRWFLSPATRQTSISRSHRRRQRRCYHLATGGAERPDLVDPVTDDEEDVRIHRIRSPTTRKKHPVARHAGASPVGAPPSIDDLRAAASHNRLSGPLRWPLSAGTTPHAAAHQWRRERERAGLMGMSRGRERDILGLLWYVGPTHVQV